MVEIRRSLIKEGITTTGDDVVIYEIPNGKKLVPKNIIINNGGSGAAKIYIYDGDSSSGVLKHIIFSAAVGLTKIPATELEGVDFGKKIVIVNDVQPLDIIIGGYEE